MKCDSCKNQMYDYYGDIGEDVYCRHDHWSGLGDLKKDKDQTLWDDCPDYEQEESENKACN